MNKYTFSSPLGSQGDVACELHKNIWSKKGLENIIGIYVRQEYIHNAFYAQMLILFFEINRFNQIFIFSPHQSSRLEFF